MSKTNHMSNRINIPGNKVQTFGRIYEDTTKEALVAHLQKVVWGQAANQRQNPVYLAEVRRIRAAIAVR